jgi:hypothetical protein
MKKFLQTQFQGAIVSAQLTTPTMGKLTATCFSKIQPRVVPEE